MTSSGSLYSVNSGGEGRWLQNVQCRGSGLSTDGIAHNQKNCNGKVNKIQKRKKIIPAVSKMCNNMLPKRKGGVGTSHNPG